MHAAGHSCRFGAALCASSVLWYVYASADQAVIALLFDPSALGLYAMAFMIASLPLEKVSTTINQVAFAIYCRLQDDPIRLKDWFLRLLALRALAIFPALAGLALVADDLVALAARRQVGARPSTTSGSLPPLSA